ncbi:MAG: nucleotide exchange factor GrpE [Calditrichaeota bacterium]|nr:MAG: nucleotide exchange factor GrpE [Calditrichota bacterium]
MKKSKEKKEKKSEDLKTEENASVEAEVDDSEVDSDDSTEVMAEEIVEEVAEETEEEKLRAKVAELEERILRNSAEFENYKKRTARQYDDMVKFANEKTISEMLEIVDNFDRALSQKNEELELESFKEGIALINSQMHDLLHRYNVKPIESLGKPFDPNLHEAMMQVESDEFEEGCVAFEMSKGYLMGDKVIRHAKVGVAKAKQEETEEK